MNSSKVDCQIYETDYEKVVEEFSNLLGRAKKDILSELEKELNPLKHIELTAQLYMIKRGNEVLGNLCRCYKKPIEINDHPVKECDTNE
jgi:hypothetical protein